MARPFASAVAGPAVAALLLADCSATATPAAAPQASSPSAPASPTRGPSGSASPASSAPTSVAPTSGPPTSSPAAVREAAAIISAALEAVGAAPVKPVTGFTLRDIPVVLGAGVDQAGIPWHEPGFPDGGVPATSFGTGAIPVRLSNGKTLEIAVAVILVPAGIPPAARPCDAPWQQPYYRARKASPCKRLAPTRGFQRTDRIYSNLAELYAWTRDRLVEMSVVENSAVQSDHPVPLDQASDDKVFLAMLPLGQLGVAALDASG